MTEVDRLVNAWSFAGLSGRPGAGLPQLDRPGQLRETATRWVYLP